MLSVYTKRQSRTDQRIRVAQWLIVTYLPVVLVGLPSCLCGFSLLCFLAWVPNHQSPALHFLVNGFRSWPFPNLSMEILKSPFHLEVRNVVEGCQFTFSFSKTEKTKTTLDSEVYYTHKYAVLKEKTKGFNRKLVDEEGNFTCNVVGFYWDLGSFIWKN